MMNLRSRLPVGVMYELTRMWLRAAVSFRFWGGRENRRILVGESLRQQSGSEPHQQRTLVIGPELKGIEYKKALWTLDRNGCRRAKENTRQTGACEKMVGYGRRRKTSSIRQIFHMTLSS
jgi:hypothetical protein